MNVFVILRIMIGGLFVFSGVEKLLHPYQNFLYVIQSYQCFDATIEELAARVVPWVEFLTGAFLILGLWSRWALRSALVLFVCFILIVGQAIIRKLPIDKCGCFGEGLSLPLPAVLSLDTFLTLVTLVLLFRIQQSSAFSLDRYFERS